MKVLSKSLLSVLTASLITSSVYAQNTTCFKNDWTSPSTIENAKLEGGECKNNFSFNEMKEKGWFLKDIKISKGKAGLNYSYLLTNEEPIKLDNSKLITANKVTKLQYKPFGVKLSNVSEEEATIASGNLRIGQSGIIEHTYENGKRLIVANAYVTKSDSNSSIVKIVPFLDLKQNAIPTSNRKPVDGDTIIMNYLYNASLVIAPSQDAFTSTRKKYKENNFLHSDLFAVKLKSDSQPLPSKQTIQDFAISQNIGTLFFVIKNYVYIVDTKTFAVLSKESISYNYIDDKKMPFYTRVEKIEKSPLDGFFSFDFLDALIFQDENKTEDEILYKDLGKKDSSQLSEEFYNNYYETLLGIKK